MIDHSVEKNVILFRMHTPEMRAVMEENGLIFTVYQNWLKDWKLAAAAGRNPLKKPPLMIFHEKDGMVHVLKCGIGIWRYFREVEAVNPDERYVRQTMVRLGELGQADEILRLYPEGTA